MKLVPSCTAADAGGGREGCWGMNQRGKARQTSQNDPDFPASGPWSWVPAAEPFLGFTGSGKKKQENRGKGEGDERQGRAKGQMGKRGEPEGAASLGDGWRRRPLACSMQTPPARLAGYTGVPNSPKSKPRASPCELCVLTSDRVYGLCQSYRMSPHNSRGPLSTLAPAVAGGLPGPQPGWPRAMS